MRSDNKMKTSADRKPLYLWNYIENIYGCTHVTFEPQPDQDDGMTADMNTLYLRSNVIMNMTEDIRCLYLRSNIIMNMIADINLFYSRLTM